MSIRTFSSLLITLSLFAPMQPAASNQHQLARRRSPPLQSPRLTQLWHQHPILNPIRSRYPILATSLSENEPSIS